jgi:uncharacterized protein with FMN-binding domain
MKRASLFVLAGAVAGFAGVLTFHARSATSPAAAGTRAASGDRPWSGNGTVTSSGSARSAIGSTEQYGYGVLDVRVTAVGNRITNVTVPTSQTNEPYSQAIAEQTLPRLRLEVLSAQSASIHAVSGASLTSQAYALSLQSALAKLHLK